MGAMKIRCALGIYLLENKEIEAFLTLLRTGQCRAGQFLCNLQTRGAFIAAFTSEKRWMTIKKSLFRHWPLIVNFFVAHL
jgi:hypothetical protein